MNTIKRLYMKNNYKIKSYIRKRNSLIRQKVRHWLGIPALSEQIHFKIDTLTKEVHANFININALEEYIEGNKKIRGSVKAQCEKHGIVDPENITQIIKNQEISNFLDYKNKILPGSMEELPIKFEGQALKYV